MKPRGPLMIEHRLIEKMIGIIETEASEYKEGTKEINPAFIRAAVDFIRTYADRTHHGKEEDILFTTLSKKPMSDEHKAMMGELVKEHVYGRSVVGELVQATEAYTQGKKESMQTILTKLDELVAFYPKHIAKEDDVFFPQTESYLTSEEQQAMLDEFWEFDRKMIHEKYEAVVKGLTS